MSYYFNHGSIRTRAITNLLLGALILLTFDWRLTYFPFLNGGFGFFVKALLATYSSIIAVWYFLRLAFFYSRQFLMVDEWGGIFVYSWYSAFTRSALVTPLLITKKFSILYYPFGFVVAFSSEVVRYEYLYDIMMNGIARSANGPHSN